MSSLDQGAVTESNEKRALPGFENDDTDKIHDETARQSRWALEIGLTNALILHVQIRFSRAPDKIGAFVFGQVAKLVRHVTVTRAMRRFESCPPPFRDRQ